MIEYKNPPVSVSQQTYGLPSFQQTYGFSANGGFTLMYDIWVCRIGPYWVLWD